MAQGSRLAGVANGLVPRRRAGTPDVITCTSEGDDPRGRGRQGVNRPDDAPAAPAHGCELGATTRETHALAVAGNPCASRMIPLESPVPAIGTPGSESGGRKRAHGLRTAARPRKRRTSHRALPVTRLPSTLPGIRRSGSRTSIVEQRADPVRAPCVHRGHRPVLAVDNASVRLARPHVHTGTTERLPGSPGLVRRREPERSSGSCATSGARPPGRLRARTSRSICGSSSTTRMGVGAWVSRGRVGAVPDARCSVAVGGRLGHRSREG